MLVALHAPPTALLIASTLLLVAAVALVATRPRGLGVAWFAGGGALIALALGLLSPRALGGILQDTWDAAATLIALFILSEALDANGFFAWAALRLARLARGSGPRLYLLTLLLTTATAALLANDGAVLMLTPIYAQLLTKISSRTPRAAPLHLRRRVLRRRDERLVRAQQPHQHPHR